MVTCEERGQSENCWKTISDFQGKAGRLAMDLALHCPCAYPLIKQGFRRAKSANHLLVRGNRILLKSIEIMGMFRLL